MSQVDTRVPMTTIRTQLYSLSGSCIQCANFKYYYIIRNVTCIVCST